LNHAFIPFGLISEIMSAKSTTNMTESGAAAPLCSLFCEIIAYEIKPDAVKKRTPSTQKVVLGLPARLVSKSTE